MTTSHRDHEGLQMISRLVRPTTPTARRVVLVAVMGLVGALTLSACGGSSASGGAPAPSSTGSPSPSSSGAGNRANSPAAPAASGEVAQISGTTMQVQNAQTGQVAVSWSTATKFSDTVTTTLAAVKAGDCLVAIAKTGTASSATSFTAASLVVSTPVNGSCTGGGRGFGNGTGQRPSGFPTGARRSGFPTGARRPSGAPTGTGGFGAFASGKVTSVSGSAVVIAAQGFGSNATTTTKTVTADAATKITTEAAATSSALKVGKCVTAQGKADSSGTVAATSVRITDPTAGQCTTGFGGFGGRNGG